MSTTLSSYLLVNKNLSKWQTITSKQPDVALQTKYYQDNITKVKTIDQFVNNYRLFSYAMTAFGLGDRVSYAKGLIRKVLQEGTQDRAALAYKLNDSRILAFARTFDFKVYGEGTTQTLAVRDQVVAQYTAQALESAQGKYNQGVQMALYFKRKAPELTNIYGILADKTLLSVVQTALDISPYMSNQPIDSQAKLLSSKLKIADFKDAKKLDNFIQRFTAMYDMNNGGTGTSTGQTANALIAGSSAVGISSDLLTTLQGLKLGGR